MPRSKPHQWWARLTFNGLPEDKDSKGIAERIFISAYGYNGIISVKEANIVYPVSFSKKGQGKNVAREPFIMCQSYDRKEMFGAGFERASSLRSAIGNCIHVTSWVSVIEGGETVNMKGRFYYMVGSPQKILLKFLEDFK